LSAFRHTGSPFLPEVNQSLSSGLREEAQETDHEVGGVVPGASSGSVSGGKTPGTRRPFIRDNLLMERAGTGSRLIIVCGLPGSGKTTLGKALESSLRAVRFSPDEWMDALSTSLWDEEMRGKIEALQWKFAQQLLALGLTVIIEWGTWGRTERDTLRLGARALGAAVELHYVSAPADVLFDRIQRRGLEKPPIERDAVFRWSEIFQAPTPEEMALFDKPLVPDPPPVEN
jgi:predicted kinase